KDIPDWEIIKFNPELNGAEPLKVLYEIAKLFIDNIGTQYPTGNVLIVAHDMINRALISVMSGKSWEDIEKISKIPHTTINVFNINIQNDKKNNINKEIQENFSPAKSGCAYAQKTKQDFAGNKA
ncbi:MAG TPA: histidine phosphatase family protein, partial [Candidatus Pacearchaeota archaeon]|nr:histidine phosphatase family protein [Candidatus Pacearchaeota archaeon]